MGEAAVGQIDSDDQHDEDGDPKASVFHFGDELLDSIWQSKTEDSS